MTRFLKGTDRPLAEAYQLALLDLDGVVYRGKNPVEYAADSIRAAEAAGMTIEYTTNNSSRFQHVVADQLKGFGLDVEPWQVITSSVVAARMVAKARRRARTGIGRRAFAR
jgi:glycerol 3-phosphatase-2